MNILQSILYGLVMGLSEFLPVSAPGHQVLFSELFGSDVQPLRNLLIHMALLAAVYVSSGAYLHRLRRSRRTSSRSRGEAGYESRLVKTAAVPMLLGLLLYPTMQNKAGSLIIVAVLFALNGIAVYIPDHLPQGNKNASNMSVFDSLLMGLSGALSIFPGVSRMGMITSVGIARGADKHQCLNWAIALSVPALILLTLFDLISLFTVGIGTVTFMVLVGYILAAVAAFAGAWGAIYFMRYLAFRVGFYAFGYYCWGVALLSFILYLTV